MLNHTEEVKSTCTEMQQSQFIKTAMKEKKILALANGTFHAAMHSTIEYYHKRTRNVSLYGTATEF